ncbi:cobyrinic acid a,c-diamide synthase [Peptoanaerobacter stomatis]|uniref:Cobyrinate a,c-diamide synthase n=1 Tax=Peptoanaerobacter stomatis TaxID=796937 RepID=V9HUA4_9FIRM|nr:cobyrinate a,c-diamide synthase [Peptoanaerobacter stomatis]EHL14894.1 cobyrinic acid a,c-diamide synthase [Peptoanaerobacter stomatis]
MKKIIIAGTSSGVGKTTITCGIMRALRDISIKVVPFKIGADYIDTTYHCLATDNTSTNLDEFMLNKNTIKRIFMQNMKSNDIAIIEGVMGLFDGYQDRDDYCSTASMSKILDSPIILIIDAGKMATSIAPIIKGFLEYDKKLNIVGIILNNVSTDSHYNILKNSIKKISNIKILGRIPKQKDINLSSRHLGLKLATEDAENEEKLKKISQIVKENIDLQSLLDLSVSPDLSYIPDNINKNYDITLAVAMDKAFNFYYKNSIEEFEKRGVKIVKFNTFTDNKLPKCDGIYIGGGYPELYARELSQNKSLIQDIKEKSENNMPIYAECGGLMYLGRHIEIENISYEMTGIFDGISKMTPKLQRFGYCIAKSLYDTPLTKKGEILKGHEFHHSVFETNLDTAFEMEKELYDKSVKKWNGGYLYKNTLASYLHIHFASNPNITNNFCQNMLNYKLLNP